MSKNIITLIAVGSIFTLLILATFLYFESDMLSITGGDIISTRVTIVEASPTPCNFTLQPGWNLVSFYCIGLFMDRDILMSNLDVSYQAIFYYDATDPDDPWKSYNPSLPNWTTQQLNFMDRLTGYWIRLETEGHFYYEGKSKASTIPLYVGWNLVGYPTNVSALINYSLSGLSYDAVKTYDAVNDVFLVYMPNSTHDITTFEVDKGYWIDSNANQSWVFP